MSLLITLLAFVLALAILIVFHEYGHYLAARMCGVRVLRFSMGFGRPLISRQFSKDGTQWVISAIPLGGYVKMLDENEGPVAPEQLQQTFNRQSVWRRIFIVAAGPGANFLLAILLYWALYISGIPDARPMIAQPALGSVAASTGLKRGDILVQIDHEVVSTWQEARWRLLQLAVNRSEIDLEVLDRRGETIRKVLDLRQFDLEGLEGDPVARLGIRLYRPDAVIGKAIPGGEAEKAGMRPGDRILSVDGKTIGTWDEFVLYVRSKADVSVRLRISNNSGESDLSITPRAVSERGKQIGRIGAEPALDEEETKNLYTTIRHGPIDSLGLALNKTWETSIFSLQMIGRMITGDVSWKNISGPVTIADYAGQSAQAGWLPYLLFIAIVSISLGVLNLLPVPLLDGGHLMYYVAEIAMGRPLSEKTMEFGQRIGVALLLVLMVFALYNDFSRLFSG
ncbi:MAG: RIP metalloprotease RseP [Burkholderiales bacterium]